MAIEIIRHSAQDEVCVEIWDTFKKIKDRTDVYLSDNPHDERFSGEISDMLFLMGRASDLYRVHAELAPTLWVRHTAENRDKAEGIEDAYTATHGAIEVVANVNMTDI